ncbi:MAG: 50S ribosomal protein L6 [Planctomycetia bacterium]|nr:50S ribosomal protein L6 [Planctomycetia bacterium]
MSRIGKQPVTIPAGVKVKIADGKLFVEGPKGKLELSFHKNVSLQLGKLTRSDNGNVFTPDATGNVISVSRMDDERLSKSIHGLMRTLVNNMVTGVTTGFEKRLKIEGVGYAAKMDKKAVVLSVGFANQIKLEPPTGVTAEVPDPNTIVVKGADKQMVGQFAAELRLARPPEPYQGKGVRYENEVVRRKEGKSFASGG